MTISTNLFRSFVISAALMLLACAFASTSQALTIDGCVIKFQSKCRFHDLRGADLHGLDLRGSDFTGSNMLGVSLRGANLGKATLNGASLYAANLNGLMARSIRGVGTEFINASMDSADFAGSDLHNAIMAGVSARDAQFWLANLGNVDISGSSDFSGANFNGANLNKISATGSSIWGADLRYTHMQCITANKKRYCTNLYKADMRDVNLWYGNMCGANTKGWLTTDANFHGTVMPNCKRHS